MLRRAAALLLLVIIATGVLFAQTKAPKAVKRVQPPKFSKTDPFYADAFKEGLVGERPADLGKAAAVATGSTVANSSAPAAGSGGPAASGAGWSRLISATTIEDSIK